MLKKIIFIFVIGIFSIARLAFAETARAVIAGTQEGSPVAGEVILNQKDGGLQIQVNVQNVPPGKHGFHIHENGSCGNGGADAGSHYNPDGVIHGMVMKDGFTQAHAGDFGNIEVGDDGKGTLEFFIPNLSLAGDKYNVASKAVILHEKEDNFDQPTGNAGGRIGCGIIEVQ